MTDQILMHDGNNASTAQCKWYQFNDLVGCSFRYLAAPVTHKQAGKRHLEVGGESFLAALPDTAALPRGNSLIKET
jgi:hypothetical protein